jgi:hypothetical protein
MANSLISMIKGDSTLINNTEVLDGQVLFNTDEKTILLDDNNTREEYGGGDESNKNLAIIEEGEVATRGYAKGTYIIWQEQLYKVLSQINSGDSFVVDGNISVDTVGQELTQVQSNLTASDNLKFKFGKDTTGGLRIRPKAPIAEEVYKCSNCGNVIRPASNMTPKQISVYTANKYGQALCSKCASARLKELKANEAAE